MHKTVSFIILLLILISPGSASAQAGSVNGTVTGKGTTIAAATVSLLNAADSSWVKSEITDDKGAFLLGDIAAGNYLMSVSVIGFATAFQSIAVATGKAAICDVQLMPEDAVLKEATVTGRKPFVEMSLGKLIINVDGSPAAAGANVLELMRRLPGVTVSQDGAISMHGKQGVLVLIDDRPTYLSGDELAAYLRTILADEVAQIELITQPGARYDAAGNTGVINIKRKKNKRPGFNGSATAAYGQGIYYNKQGSLLLNYKKNKLNLSLNGSNMEAIGFANWEQDQYYKDAASGTVLSSAHISSRPVEHFSIGSLRLAADYDCTDNTTIGASVRGGYHPNSMSQNSRSLAIDQQGATIYSHLGGSEGFIRKDLVANAYLTHKFSKESTLDINFDYLTYNNDPHQDLSRFYYDPAGTIQSVTEGIRSHQPTLIDIYSAKADYTYSFAHGLKLEAGAKTSWVTTDNDAVFTTLQNNTWIPDTGRTNHFVYKENINAAYLSLSKSLGNKWDVRAGLRAEQTIADGAQYVHSRTFTRNYLSLFPTAYIDYKADSNNQFELNFGRRIDRPAYQSLNPFIYYSFQYSYSVGNPSLMPMFTNSAELKHSYKNMLITTLGYSATTNVISNILATDANGAIYTTDRNLASSTMYYATVVFNKDVTKWWSLNCSGMVYDQVFTATIQQQSLQKSLVAWGLNMDSQFDFGKQWKGECGIYYGSRTLASIYQTDGGSLFSTVGVSKKFSDKFLAKLTFTDPFNLYKMSVDNDLASFNAHANFIYATQMLRCALTYTFGTAQQSARQLANMEETKRMKIDQ